MKHNHLKLAVVILVITTVQIYAHDFFEYKPEEIPTSLSENQTRLTATKGAIAATIQLSSPGATTGNIASLSKTSPATLINSIKKQVELTPAQEAALAHNFPSDQNNPEAWNNFNTQLDKILTAAKTTINHEQLIRDLHESQNTTNTLDTMRLATLKLFNKVSLPADAPKRGYTIESTAHNQIISIFPETMRSLHDELRPEDLEKFNSLLEEKIPEIQKANQNVIAKLLGGDGKPSSIRMQINDLSKAILPENFSDLSDENKNTINAFLKNISHLVDTEVLVGLDGENRAANISRLDSGHALHVDAKNYTQIKELISIFTSNLPYPDFRKPASAQTTLADQSGFSVENPTKASSKKQISTAQTIQAPTSQYDIFKSSQFKSMKPFTHNLQKSIQEERQVAGFRNSLQRSPSPRSSVRDLLPPASSVNLSSTSGFQTL